MKWYWWDCYWQWCARLTILMTIIERFVSGVDWIDLHNFYPFIVKSNSIVSATALTTFQFIFSKDIINLFPYFLLLPLKLISSSFSSFSTLFNNFSIRYFGSVFLRLISILLNKLLHFFRSKRFSNLSTWIL